MLALPSICTPEKKNTSIRPCPALSKSSRPPSVKRLCSGLCCSETVVPSGERRCARKAAAAGIGEAAPTAMCRAPAMRRSTTAMSTSSGLRSSAASLISCGTALEDILVEIAAEAVLGRGEPEIVEDVPRVFGIDVAEFERPSAARSDRHCRYVESGDRRRRHHLVLEEIAVVQLLDRDDAAS